MTLANSQESGKSDHLRTLIDELLDEQQRLTVVERFARKHERGEVPAQERYYRALIPIQKPRAGEQYAFAVDLDRCTGCKGCVSACHSLNGLDEEEIWRNVGLIHGGTTANPYQQTVTTACHHCADPACANGCPVLAYEKDEETGIVRHLDDQCIGCQYCSLKCPYDVPKYSKRRGIVRKCDMCYNRLAADEAPACVQACPTSAITIRVVSKEALAARTKMEDRLIPGAFTSSYTKPTTQYTTRHSIPGNARAADALRPRLEHAHWPLIWMLVFTQAGAGLYAMAAGIALLQPELFAHIGPALTVAAFLALNAGLGTSVFHLGRPLKAWRAFLGWRKSWMSREILVFSGFAAASGVFTLFANPELLAHLAPQLAGPLAWWAGPAGAITTLFGIAAVGCSAMIYVDTQRPFWRAFATWPKFLGTCVLLGLLGTAVIMACEDAPFATPMFAGVAVFWMMAAWESGLLIRGSRGPSPDLHRVLSVHLGPLSHVLGGRLLCGIWMTVAAGIAVTLPVNAAAGVVALVFLLGFAAAVLERFCFFVASNAPRMPGSIAA